MNINFYTLLSFTHRTLRLLLPSILLLATINCSATNWHTVRIGPANSLSTWSDGTTSPSTFATPGDTWTINDSIFIPRSATWTIGTASSTPVSLILGPRGELGSEYGGNVKLIVFGDVLIRGGRMEHYTNMYNDTMYIHGNVRIDSGIIDFTATSARQCIYIDSNLIVHGGTIRQAANTPKRFISVGLDFEITAGVFECSGTASELNLEVAGNCNFDSSYLNFSGNSPTITFKINGTSSMTQNKIIVNGNSPKFYDTVYGNANIHNNYFYTYGNSPKSYYTFYGNSNIVGDTLYSYGTRPFTRFDITGNCDFNYDSVSSDGNSPELQMVVHGNLSMVSSHLAYMGTYAVISDTVYGNCSITGSSYFSNNRTLNTIHLALPSSAGTMQIENTSNGPWSRTTVYVDSGCTAQLSNHFSTSTGVSPTYGLIVNGKLICPAAYAASGTGIFTLNQYGMLTVANALGINGNITTSGVTSFSPAATYLYDGSVAQVTGSYLPMSLTALSQFIINNRAGVTLSRSTATTGILQFNTGILHTDTASITTRGIAGAVIGTDARKYVDGLLCKTITGATTLQFEVGDTSYAPMQLAMSSMGTSGKIGVRCVAGLHPNVSASGINVRNIVNHYWSVQNYAASGPTTVVPTVNYNYASILGGSNLYFKGQRYSSGSWLSSSLSCTNTTSTYASIIDSPVTLSSMQGDYIFGNTCSTIISGRNVICAIGDTSTLTSSSTGGVWISSDTSIASVSSSGIVTGRAHGQVIIYYTTSSCASSIIVYVGVSAITGITTICPSSFTTLFDSTLGGAWSSSTTSVATVTASGVVYAVSPGTSVIYYTVGTCSPVSTTVTVSSLTPISGAPTVTLGDSTLFTCTTSGGTWSSSNASIASVSSVGRVYGSSLGSATISYTLGTCYSTQNINILFAYRIIDDSAVGYDTICNRPTFYVKTNRYSPFLILKNYYGDGTFDSTSFTPIGAVAVAYPTPHLYSLPGYYTVRQSLYFGSTLCDSITNTYFQNHCSTISMRFYHDNNSNCLRDFGETINRIPIDVEIDSSGIAIDTLSATSGCYYTKRGAPGCIYRYRILDTSLNTTCFSSGRWSDTVSSTSSSSYTKFIGLSCVDTNTYNLRVLATSRFGRRAFQFNVNVSNLFCAFQSSDLVLKLTPRLNFGSSIPAPTSISGRVITWHYSGLSALSGSESISGYFTSSSSFTIGDTLHTSYQLTPIAGDIDTTDNKVDRVDTVVGSYDPNYIEVIPAGCFRTDSIFQYTVHFENMGNDTAFNIYVLDTISSYLDVRSLKILAASHDMNVYTQNYGIYKVLKFDFPNINLLDSSYHNLCDGSFTYSIKKFATMPDGAIIDNRAGIYFDYNPVVMTNTVSSIKGCRLDVPKVETFTDGLLIYPNPNSGELTIKSEFITNNIVITDLLGKELISTEGNLKESHLNLAHLSSGIYILKINNTIVRKIVKE